MSATIKFVRAYLMCGRVWAAGARTRVDDRVAAELATWGVAEVVDPRGANASPNERNASMPAEEPAEEPAE